MAADEDARPETEEWKLQAEEFKSQGNEAFKQGSWKEAVEKYTQAIELDPEDKVYYSNRSAAYLKMGDAKSKALKDAEKCMKLDENWPKAYSRLGAAQHALKRFDAAIDTLRQGLRLDPDSASLQSSLKVAQDAKEEEREARWAQAKKEREAEEQRLKDAEEAKLRKAEEEVAAAADEDPLAGFFSEINKEADANNGIKKEDKVMNEKYLNQELGTAQQQVDRLLGSNYKWKNLNPYEVLLLDVDATVEDIKARYRKLSTMVHPDKQRHIENARDAFEEVKKAYQALLDEGRRNTVAETIQIVRKRVAKERSKLTSKGMTAAQLLEKHGTEEAHSKREVMKEFAAIEVRRREIDDHKAAQKKRERDKEDKEHKDLKKVHEREKTWNQDDGREKRVGNWRDFTTAKPEATKKTRMWKEEEREVEEEKKKGGVAAGKFNYKKQWK